MGGEHVTPSPGRCLPNSKIPRCLARDGGGFLCQPPTKRQQPGLHRRDVFGASAPKVRKRNGPGRHYLYPIPCGWLSGGHTLAAVRIMTAPQTETLSIAERMGTMTSHATRTADASLRDGVAYLPPGAAPSAAL